MKTIFFLGLAVSAVLSNTVPGGALLHYRLVSLGWGQRRTASLGYFMSSVASHGSPEKSCRFLWAVNNAKGHFLFSPAPLSKRSQ